MGVQEVIFRTKSSKTIVCEPNNAENEEAISFRDMGCLIEDIESLASTNSGEIIYTCLFHQIKSFERGAAPGNNRTSFGVRVCISATYPAAHMPLALMFPYHTEKIRTPISCESVQKARPILGCQSLWVTLESLFEMSSYFSLFQILRGTSFSRNWTEWCRTCPTASCIRKCCDGTFHLCFCSESRAVC